jgi:hypothetical protein
MKIRSLIYGLALTIALAFPLISLIEEGYVLHDVIAGIVLAVLNGLLAAAINGLTLGKDQSRFMIWNLGGNACRAGLLLLAIVCAPALGITNMTVFAVVTFSGYFSFLVFEIAAITRQSRAMAPAS